MPGQQAPSLIGYIR